MPADLPFLRSMIAYKLTPPPGERCSGGHAWRAGAPGARPISHANTEGRATPSRRIYIANRKSGLLCSLCVIRVHTPSRVPQAFLHSSARRRQRQGSFPRPLSGPRTAPAGRMRGVPSARCRLGGPGTCATTELAVLQAVGPSHLCFRCPACSVGPAITEPCVPGSAVLCPSSPPRLAPRPPLCAGVGQQVERPRLAEPPHPGGARQGWVPASWQQPAWLCVASHISVPTAAGAQNCPFQCTPACLPAGLPFCQPAFLPAHSLGPCTWQGCLRAVLSLKAPAPSPPRPCTLTLPPTPKPHPTRPCRPVHGGAAAAGGARAVRLCTAHRRPAHRQALPLLALAPPAAVLAVF